MSESEESDDGMSAKEAGKAMRHGTKAIDGDETESESGSESGLYCVADTSPGHYVVGNPESGTAYHVNLNSVTGSEGKPCECPDSHYRQSPEDFDVCKHVLKAIKEGDSSIDMALAEELAAVRHMVDNLLQSSKEINSSIAALNSAEGGAQSGNRDAPDAQKGSGPDAEKGAEKLNDIWPVDGMQAKAYGGKVWLNKTPDAPDWTFQTFLQNPDIVEFDPDGGPGDYYKNYVEPRDVSKYISEVLE